MIRNTLMLPVLALLAASSVQGADFPFRARVDVLQSIDIDVAGFSAPSTSAAALSMHGTQDQCLDLRWLDGDGEVLSGGTDDPDRAADGPFRLGAGGYGVIAPDAEGLVDGSTLQVNLN